MFFDIFMCAGGSIRPLPCNFVVGEPVPTRFRTGIDHHSVNLNMKKDLHKINDVIVHDVIILRPLSFVQKHTKQKT